MRGWSIVIGVALLAAGAPLLPAATKPAPPVVRWPSTFEGRALMPIAPSALDRRLADEFPGRIARFSDGRRQIVLRSVPAATRQLHPARNCFRAIGYDIAPAPMLRTRHGALASCFHATRRGVTLNVCERVTDRDGGSFADIPSWYWPALLGQSRGPWLASTSVERIR